ncbi:MAG: hypothetical protein AAGG72_05535, partial [Pseudomonadota bacterium]
MALDNTSGNGARGRGRPKGSVAGKSLLSHKIILDKAWQLARREDLADISIVRLADALGATAAALRYHIGSREQLTSEIINRLFREVHKVLNDMPSNDWEADLRLFYSAFFDALMERPGLARYLLAHSEFRVFQSVETDREDYSVKSLDKFMVILKSAGLSPLGALNCAQILFLNMLALAIDKSFAVGEGQALAYQKAFKSRGETGLGGFAYVASAFDKGSFELTREVLFEVILASIKTGAFEPPKRAKK